MGSRRSKNIKTNAIIIVMVFFVVLLAVVISMSIQNITNQQSIIEDSIKAQLLSISFSARELIDVDAFVGYRTPADTDAAYEDTLAQLRELAASMNVDYIYVLREVSPGKYVFIFDTDTDENSAFTEFDLSPVHRDAFDGIYSTEILNDSDEHGIFNTGAIPIWKDGKIVGIVATTTWDTYLTQSQRVASNNIITLIIILALTMGATLSVVVVMTNRIRDMQRGLEHIALHDAVTGLPNRQSLMRYLDEATAHNKPFTLFFVDLDNFKLVNDNDGHDAGDESLKSIAQFLQRFNTENSHLRHSPGFTARIGGDEFVSIVPGLASPELADTYTEKLLDEFRTTEFNQYIIKNQVGLSIGMSFFPEQSRDPGTLIKMADAAMYCSKNDGKGCARTYNNSMPIG